MLTCHEENGSADIVKEGTRRDKPGCEDREPVASGSP